MTSGAASGLSAARRAAPGGADQAGGRAGAGQAELGGDAEVGVGGQHDAGVAELVSDHFQVGAGARA